MSELHKHLNYWKICHFDQSSELSQTYQMTYGIPPIPLPQQLSMHQATKLMILNIKIVFFKMLKLSFKSSHLQDPFKINDFILAMKELEIYKVSKNS